MRTGNVQLIGFSILHILGTACIPLLIFLLTGCIKKEDIPVNYGPEISSEAIGDAVYYATQGKTLADAKVNEWALTEFTLSVFTEPDQTEELSGKQIKSKTDGGDRYNFEILKTTYDHEQSPPTVSNQQIENCQAMKDGSGHSCEYSPMLTELSNSVQSKSFSTLSKDMTISPQATSVTYHNLSSVKVQQPPPPLVASATNCGGVPNCVMNVTRIEFDEVVHASETTRYHHEFTFSKDGPFLSIVLSHCVKYNAKVGTRYLPASQCTYVRNFVYGN